MLTLTAPETVARRNQNHAHAALYIEALTGARDTPMTWCLLHDKKITGMRPYNLYGSLNELAPRLKALNKGGYGVFLAVNEVAPKARRTQANVTALRALFVESDQGEMRAPSLPPSFSVQSARGRHVYWKLGQGEAIGLFSESQKHLAAYFGSDPVVHDLPRLMRVPGFLHQKGEPFVVTFHAGSGEEYSISDVLNAHPVAVDKLKSIRKAKATRDPQRTLGASSHGSVSMPSMSERKARATAYVRRMPAAVEGQGGDCQTFKAACYVVRGFAVDNFDDAMDVMRQYNATCSPPWDESELADKVANALKHGSGDVGAMLDRPSPGGLTRVQEMADADRKDDSPSSECDAANDDRMKHPASNAPYSLDLLELLADNPANALNPDVIKSLATIKFADPEEYARCLWELKQSGLGMVQDVRRAVTMQVAEDSQAASVAKMKATDGAVVSALPSAGEVVSGEHRVPYGYSITGHGITKLVPKTHRDGTVEIVEVPVCPRPLVIAAVLDRIGDDGVLFEMAFRTLDTDRWVTVTASRDVALTARLLNALAEHRFPVDSGNAGMIVAYLSAYETANEKLIPRRASTVQMGWHKSGEADVFVLGAECLVPAKATPPITFIGDSAGDKHLASCYQRKGTIEGWNEAMKLVVEHPRVELAVVGALATLLMDVVQAPSFALDFCGQSSTGKTTTMRIAASTFGVPDERSQHSLIHSWNTTQVGLERLAATNRDLPLLMDETKQAPVGPKGRSMVPEAIYQITNGQGKARGAIEGRRKTLYWRTLMLTTGESAAVDQSKDMGPAARVLTLWGSPFGGYSDDVGKIEALINDNYGHAGPMFAQWLVSNRPQHEANWRRRYAETTEDLRLMMPTMDAGVASRIAKYLALLELTAWLLRSAVGMPWNGCAVRKVLPDIAKGAAPFDRPLEALRHMYHLAVSEKATFWGCHDSNHPPPRFNGFWRTQTITVDGEQVDDYPYIAFFPDYLEQRLKAAGFDFEATVKLWHDRGWLVVTANEQRRTLRVRMNKDVPRLFAVSRQAIEAAC